jgi:hypothetical protein
MSGVERKTVPIADRDMTATMALIPFPKWDHEGIKTVSEKVVLSSENRCARSWKELLID